MNHSVLKFLDRPIVQQSSTTKLDNIKMPIIYVCQDAQYKINMSHLYGYQYLSDFISGTIKKSDKITWKGKYNNATYEELKALLFDVNYEDFSVYTYNSKLSEGYHWQLSTAEKVFIAPHGLCMRLSQSQGSTYFGMKSKFFFLIVDPERDNRIKILHMENGNGELGPSVDKFYDYYSYEMEIRLHDNSLEAGKTCADYPTSYGECLEYAMMDKLMDWYGCLPPWFDNNSTASCNLDTYIYVTDKKLLKEMSEEFNRLSVGQELRLFDSCLPPCVKMSIKLKQQKHISNQLEEAGLRIDLVDKDVKVYTLVYAYDVFNLVVDLGSSLGLWFGLSAISIYDNTIHIFMKYKLEFFY